MESKLLIEGAYYIPVIPPLANAIGNHKKAAILQQVYYWMKIFEESDDPSVRKKHFHDGRWWVFNTYEEWYEQLGCFCGLRKLKDYFQELEDSGLLISGNYNKWSLDRTKWYTVDVEKVRNLVNSHSAETAQSKVQKLHDAKCSDCTSNTIEYYPYNTLPENTVKEVRGVKGNCTEKTCNSDSHEHLTNYEILERYIHSMCKEQEIDSQYEVNKIYNVIAYYHVQYGRLFGEDHPYLNGDGMRKIVLKIYCPPAEIEQDLEIEDWKAMINKHFDTDYAYCDYNMIHFVEDNILINRYYEAVYNREPDYEELPFA